jgi:hypothetical protein
VDVVFSALPVFEAEALKNFLDISESFNAMNFNAKIGRCDSATKPWIKQPLDLGPDVIYHPPASGMRPL